MSDDRSFGFMRRRSARTGVFAMSVVAALALAGCSSGGGAGGSGSSTQPSGPASSGPTDVVAHAEGLSGQARTDYLVAQAKAEGGTLTLYSSYSASSLDKIVGAFEKAYDIKVTSYRAASEDVLTRVLQESEAGYGKGADAVEMRGTELYQADQKGLVRGFKGDFTDKVPDYAKFDNWTADRLNVIVPCWNTDKVPAGQEPKSYAEFAEPKWKGKLAIEQSDSNWFETMYEYMLKQGKTDQQVLDYFHAVVANASVVKGHTQMQTNIVSGQQDVGVDCYSYITEQQKAKGAPTAWEPAVSPAVSQPNGVAILKGAKHPAAAALFYQWILTDGQKVLADAGNTPVTSKISVEVIPLDIEGYVKDPKKWDDLYDKVLRG